MNPHCGEHFGTTCIIGQEIRNLANEEGADIINRYDEWVHIFDIDPEVERCLTLSWLLYIGWFCYHRASYATDEEGRALWSCYKEEHLSRTVR